MLQGLLSPAPEGCWRPVVVCASSRENVQLRDEAVKRRGSDSSSSSSCLGSNRESSAAVGTAFSTFLTDGQLKRFQQEVPGVVKPSCFCFYDTLGKPSNRKLCREPLTADCDLFVFGRNTCFVVEMLRRPESTCLWPLDNQLEELGKSVCWVAKCQCWNIQNETKSGKNIWIPSGNLCCHVSWRRVKHGASCVCSAEGLRALNTPPPLGGVQVGKRRNIKWWNVKQNEASLLSSILNI